jgi:hypothetical protein
MELNCSAILHGRPATGINNHSSADHYNIHHPSTPALQKSGIHVLYVLIALHNPLTEKKIQTYFQRQISQRIRTKKHALSWICVKAVFRAFKPLVKSSSLFTLTELTPFFGEFFVYRSPGVDSSPSSEFKVY